MRSIRAFAFDCFERGLSAWDTKKAVEDKFQKGGWGYVQRLHREWLAGQRK